MKIGFKISNDDKCYLYLLCVMAMEHHSVLIMPLIVVLGAWSILGIWGAGCFWWSCFFSLITIIKDPTVHDDPTGVDTLTVSLIANLCVLEFGSHKLMHCLHISSWHQCFGHIMLIAPMMFWVQPSWEEVQISAGLSVFACHICFAVCFCGWHAWFWGWLLC